MFKPNLHDKNLKIKDLYHLCLLFDLDLQKVNRMIYYNLSASQRSHGHIDFNIFTEILKYYNIKLNDYIAISNDRGPDDSKIQTFYELANVWHKVRAFYLERFSNKNSKNYNKDVINTVNEISELLKSKNVKVKDKVWIMYMFLECKELSYIK